MTTLQEHNKVDGPRQGKHVAVPEQETAVRVRRTVVISDGAPSLRDAHAMYKSYGVNAELRAIISRTHDDGTVNQWFAVRSVVQAGGRHAERDEAQESRVMLLPVQETRRGSGEYVVTKESVEGQPSPIELVRAGGGVTFEDLEAVAPVGGEATGLVWHAMDGAIGIEDGYDPGVHVMTTTAQTIVEPENGTFQVIPDPIQAMGGYATNRAAN